MSADAAYLEQYSALTRRVGFAPLAGRTILAVVGSDRTTFLNAFCTNNVKALQPGHGCEAFITSPQGKTVGHVFVFCEADQLLLDTAPGQAANLIAHFDKYVISEDVQFIDRSAELSDLLVAGPNATALLTQLTSAEPPSELLAQTAATIASYSVHIYRVEYAGPASFFVQAASAALPAIEQALAASGVTRSGAAAVESARLEAGIPIYGVEITADNLPQEVGRDAQAISFTKGCYLGQETMARLDALGHVNRHLVGVRFTGGVVPVPGTPLLAGDKEVGQVTSAAWSPALQAPLAWACVRRLSARPGARLESACGPAEVVRLPVTAS